MIRDTAKSHHSGFACKYQNNHFAQNDIFDEYKSL
jgi:hypothetical protein